MMPEQDASIWQDNSMEEPPSAVPQESVISGSVSPEAYQIPLGNTPNMIFPQTNAALALVLAIASFACGGFLMSIPALLIALSAKKITDTNHVHPDRGIANAAYIAAIVNICLSTLISIGYVAAVIIYTT